MKESKSVALGQSDSGALGEQVEPRKEASQHSFRAGGMATIESALKATRDRLQSTIEQYAAALEALSSGNEAYQAAKPGLLSIAKGFHTVCRELDLHVEQLVGAEAQQRMLVAELNHRVRNMLQVVMGLASQSVHRSHDLQEFEKAFSGRMQALARAYDLLSRDGWRKVPVPDLVRNQLAPFTADSGRYRTTGDAFTMTANGALSLGLVLYELATNATKYGALSLPTGHVRIEWTLESQRASKPEFVLRWEEIGGPTVESPTRHGFGTELVQRQLKYELNGNADMDFRKEGLVVTMRIPAKEALEL